MTNDEMTKGTKRTKGTASVARGAGLATVWLLIFAGIYAAWHDDEAHGAVGTVPAAGATGTNQLVGTNGTTLGSAGTVNWTTGVTGYMAGAVCNLGITASGTGGGNTNGSIQLAINNAKPALTNQPAFEGNYLADELLFPRTNTVGTDIALSANWSFVVPTRYATNTAIVRIIHSITATNGPNASNVVWRASFIHSESGSTTDLRVGTFGTAYLVTNAWAACFNCTNQAAISTIAFTNESGLSPGGLGILKLERVSTSDGYVGAASLIGLQIDYGE
jgi:hypothetical protein